MRDSQRSKVYAAERVAFPAHLGGPRDTQDPKLIMTLPECQERVTEIWHSKWSKKQFPQVWYSPPSVGDGRGSRRARGGRSSIQLPVWSRTMPVLLHELAHSFYPRVKHSREWARAYVALVECWMSPRDAKRLRDAFKVEKVKYKRKKALTPEVKQQLRERMLTLVAGQQYSLKN